MKLSIRYKILCVLSVLLLLAIGFYTLLASSIFREEKTALLYDLNHSLAINTAAQLDSSLRRVGDQVKLYAISRIVANNSRMRLSARYLQEASVIAADLYRLEDGKFVEFKLPAEVSSTRLELPRLNPYLEEARSNQFAFWNQIVQEQLPRYFLASRFDLEINDKTETFITVAELESRTFFESIQAGGLFEMFVFRKNGDLLFRCDHGKLLPPTAVANHPILSGSSATTTGSGVQSFEFNGQRWYGAVAPVGVSGLSVLSQASRSEVTAALTTLVQRSLLFALIVVTVTFIASVLFSKRLTRGLKILADGAQRIGEGDLQSTIEIRTGDEVEKVAASFNKMVEALRVSREAIERYNRELEDKVALRTKQLQETNAAIKDVQEKLLRTTQLATVGEVAGRTAHELLNPLTAILSRLERSRLVVEPAGAAAAAASAPARQLTDILTAWETDFRKGGMSELVRSLTEPSPIAPQQTLFEEDLENLKKLAGYWQTQTDTLGTDLSFVQDQAQRIHRIIDRMREYVRSSVKSEIHCHSAIEEAVQTMADYLAKNGVVLERKLNAEADLAILNRDELVQIISNLMRNSLQAIGARKTTGKISVVTADSGPVLTIDITDNGIGITKDKQRFLFEQGFTTKAPSEGTGLGLAICRRYARAFGGEVELLFSEPDTRGTCFRISVPLHTAVQASKAAS